MESFRKLFSHCGLFLGLNKRTIILAVLVCTLAGCDRCYTTWQTVGVRISSLGHGEVSRNVLIEVAGMHPHHYEGQEHEWLDRFADRATTDTNGNASIDVRCGIICGWPFPGMIRGPDFSRDRVTGRVYLARIAGNRAQEPLKIEMLPSAKTHGDKYGLTILEIGKPRRRK